MKKNADTNTTKSIDVEKLKKQKKREAAKAKRLKMLEKRRAKVEANKKKRAEKKEKRLAKLEKARAKKAALREQKKIAKQKKLERLAKQKAREKALKLKQKEKEQKLKQKARAKAKLENKQTKFANFDILASANAVVDVVKCIAKEYAKLNENKQAAIAKKLKKLGFTFDGGVKLMLSAKNPAKETPVQTEAVEPVVEPKVVKPEAVEVAEIDDIIDAKIGESGAELAALADELEDDETNDVEVPAGDTFTDDVVRQPNGFEDDEDDDIMDDHRDEKDDDKVSFRREWNNEFDDDGERDENW